MNDTDVDARLTENARLWRDERPAGPALADVLADVGLSASAPTDGAVRKPRRTRLSVGAGRQLVALAAVAVVVAAVVLVGVVIRVNRGETTHPNGLPTAHPGDVSYHGITLTVPPSWPVAPAFCSSPTVDAVVPDTGLAVSCPYIQQSKTPATNTLVYLAPETDTSDQVTRIATSKTTVGGVNALRGRGTDGRNTLRRRAVTVLIIPSLDVVIEIAASKPAVADTILDTVRITPVDRYGCRGHIETVVPTDNRSSATLVPGRPTSGYVCEYRGLSFAGRSRPLGAFSTYGLVGSSGLTAGQLDILVRGLRTFGSRTLVGPDTLQTFSPPFLWFVLRYADGTSRTIASTLDQVAYDGHWIYHGHLKAGLPTPFDR